MNRPAQTLNLWLGGVLISGGCREWVPLAPDEQAGQAGGRRQEAEQEAGGSSAGNAGSFQLVPVLVSSWGEFPVGGSVVSS